MLITGIRHVNKFTPHIRKAPGAYYGKHWQMLLMDII